MSNVFFSGKFFGNSTGSLGNVIFENAGHNLNNVENTDTSETESCLSSESEINKIKCDRLSANSKILINTWKVYYCFFNVYLNV